MGRLKIKMSEFSIDLVSFYANISTLGWWSFISYFAFLAGEKESMHFFKKKISFKGTESWSFFVLMWIWKETLINFVLIF